MKITSVKTQRLEQAEGAKLLGVARVVIDDCFAIADIRIIRGDAERGLFVAFPSRKQTSGEFKDVCHPINAKTRKMFEDVILTDFNKGDTDETDTVSN